MSATRFGEDVEITVNYGEKDYRAKNAVLPRYGDKTVDWKGKTVEVETETTLSN
jgi:hypothetical protein